MKAYEIDIFKKVRAMIVGVLAKPERYEWTLQGFGMLRTYLSAELRLHIWDHGFRTQSVSDVHDHPWHFSSLVVSGVITNTRYKVHPCTHGENMVRNLRLRQPFIRSQIVCGIGGNNDPAELRARGERVWLEPLEPETYKAGDEYRQLAHEVHHTSFSTGAVTLVQREFLPDTEHAHVYFKADEDWVSAEPVPATRFQVTEICERALAGWKDHPTP